MIDNPSAQVQKIMARGFQSNSIGGCEPTTTFMPSEPADDPELKAGAEPLSLDGRNHDDDDDDAAEKYDENFCDNHGVHFQSLEEPKDMPVY